MKTQNPLIGRASQKFSNAIFQTWKGINVVRSKPLEVANPQSPAQTVQRNKFGAMVALARQYLQTARLGLRSQAVRQSEYNAFISLNIDLQDSDGSGIDISVSEQIIGARGTLAPVEPGTASTTSTTFSTTWNNDRFGAAPTDQVCIGVFYQDVDGKVVAYRELTRSVLASAEAVTNLPMPEITGLNYQVYVIFVHNPEGQVSDSRIAF